MLMQNFGVTNKQHYGMLWYFWSGQLQDDLILLQLQESTSRSISRRN